MLDRKPRDSVQVYLAIKARALACGFSPGKPIRPGHLAAQLGVSTTPIRAALHMLAAEGLVTRHPRKGFMAMPLSIDRFVGMYRLNQFLLDVAVATHEAGAGVLAAASSVVAGIAAALDTTEDDTPDVVADYTGLLFSGIAQLSGNPEVVRTIEHISESLCYVRTLEAKQFDGIPGELTAICEPFLAERRDEVVEAIEKYHARRLALLPELLASLRR